MTHRPSRRDFLRSAGAAALTVPAATNAAKAATPRKPNILLIMADDMGYSDIGCYGGEVNTPNLNGLAAGGMRFTQFYNNAKCAPTRASLLTGLYSQQVGVTNGPEKMEHCATIAEVMRGAGYKCYMAGKWHAKQLPTERGFDHYFGLADGCANYFNPGNQRPGEPKPANKHFPRKWARDGEVMQPFTPKNPNFYSTDAFTDAALDFLGGHDSQANPFFLYVAYTSPHYPLQVPPEEIAKYRGKYKIGWDELRQRRYKRMIELGLIDAQWALSPRDARVPAWEDVEKREAWDLKDLGEDKRRGIHWDAARDRDLWDLKMAVYAGMIDRMDQNIGRILDKLRAMGEMDNTLILFLSDNGGCAELCNVTPEVPPGPVNSYRSVDPPWANAQNTPFRYYKRYDHEGGISTPLIAHWPGQVPKGALTDQVGHLIDIMATCADIGGAEYPTHYGDHDVLPLEGKSLLPVLKGGTRKGHDHICWEFNNCRAIRSGKWKLVSADGSPWELYDMEKDRTELHNLVDTEPERVRTMRDAWVQWAKRCGARIPEKKHA